MDSQLGQDEMGPQLRQDEMDSQLSQDEMDPQLRQDAWLLRFHYEILVDRKRAMNFKQCFILVAAISGILLVVLSPRWYYPPHPLTPNETKIGYGLITQPPTPLPVFKEENGQTFSTIQPVAPRIDRKDLSMRIGLINAITVCGLWILQARKKQIKKRQPI